MLYLVSGREEFLREDFLGQLKALMRKLPMGEHNIDEPAASIPIQELIAICDTAPFLCQKRMVIARGVVGQAVHGRGRRTRSAPASQQKAEPEPLQRLLEYVRGLPESTHLVLVEESGTELQPFAEAKPDAVRRDFPSPRDGALPGWIIERARTRGVRIASRAAAALTQLIGPELRRLDSEVAKLAAYVSPGQAIQEADLEMLVAGGGPTIFAFQDAVAERRGAAALGATCALLDRGSDPMELFAQLVALVRRLLIVHEIKAERLALTREAPSFGLTSSQFALDKLQRQATRFTVAELERSYEMLLETDLAIKTGQIEPELAVYLAVARLVGISPNSNATREWSGSHEGRLPFSQAS